MAGITGLTTTFNSNNYHGELITVTPTDTPLLSAAGGISPTGGQQTDSTAFEWQTEDMRDPASRPRLEGADAPTAEARVRANMENVVQIFQEAVSTSYTKQATSGQHATVQSAPYQSLDGLGQGNPITNEHDHQVALTLKQIARDLNWTMWHGKKVKPTTNATARQMGGMFEFVENGLNSVANVTYLSPQSAALSAATDTITEASTSAVNGDKVVFTQVGASTTLRPDRVYYVVQATAGSFKVSLTPGGSPVTIGTATVRYVEAGVAVTPTIVGTLLGQIFDNGGIAEQDTATLWVSSTQRMKLTAAYATAYGQTDLFKDSRTVGGVAMTQIVTDFGTLNLATERALPPDCLFVTSTEQIEPVFLNIPGKGVLFEEELAKTGASEKSQVYGEIGMKAGNPLAHGYIRGLAI